MKDGGDISGSSPSPSSGNSDGSVINKNCEIYNLKKIKLHYEKVKIIKYIAK